MSGDWDGVVALLTQAGALKRLPRQGWLHVGVPAPESVAGHSYRVALMTLLLAKLAPGIDLARALTLAIIHDLPEAIAGDATPFDQHLADEMVDRETLFRSRPAYSPEADQAKRAAEEAALARLTRGLPPVLARFVTDAWEEYEANATPEARLVRQVDKLEALLQAEEYRAEQPDLPVDSFLVGADAAAVDPDVRALLTAIVARFGRPDSA